MTNDEDDRTLEAIYDALDGNAPEEALRLAVEALAREEEDDPVLNFLAGVALLQMDQPTRAVDSFRRALALDPEDAEFRANLALALFRSCRFAEGSGEAKAAVGLDPSCPDAQAVLGLFVEREGQLEEADRCFLRAAQLDPERFPAPFRLSRAAFEREVAAAGDRLPESFRSHLADVAVTVDVLPSDEILLDSDPPLDPELLGLFVGRALDERSSFVTGGDPPPRILVFQRNLERYADGAEGLRDEIAVTLYHELGHYLGLDEEELEAIDLA